MNRKYNKRGIMYQLQQYPYINTSYQMAPNGQLQDRRIDRQMVDDYNLTVGKKYPTGGYMQVPQQSNQPQAQPQIIPQEGNYGVQDVNPHQMGPQEMMTAKSGGYMNRMQRYESGGTQLEGGQMHPIPGSDAVQFTGASHNQGGIMLDPTTEVEGGETMDQVTMAEEGGQKKDYFFSDHLKKGGMSYAAQHKKILAGGGDQKQIDMLAKMQEYQAGRNPQQVQTARTGGVHQYQRGGEKASDYAKRKGGDWPEGVKDPIYNEETNQWEFDDGTPPLSKRDAMKLGYEVNGGGEIPPQYQVNNEVIPEEVVDETPVAEEVVNATTATEEVATEENKSKYPIASDEVYGDIEGEYGDIPDYQPGYKVGDVQMYAGEDDAAFRGELQKEDFKGNWMTNADPAVLEAAGITNFDDMNDPAAVTKYQEAWNTAHPDSPVVVDGKFGEQTWRTALGPAETSEEVEVGGEEVGGEVDIEDGVEGDEEETLEKKKDWLTPLVAASQLLPAIYAFGDKPDYMTDHPMASPGAIIPERISKTHLERIDMNPEKARNSADFATLNRFIDTAGGGPSGMINRMAAYAKKQQGDREISAQESRANVAIANQEGVMDQDRKARNVTNALSASQFNISQRTETDRFNATQERMVDEFNRGADAATTDRRLNALDSVVGSIAGMNADRLAYKAQERMATAISGQTGNYDRDLYAQALLANNYVKGTDSYNNMMNAFAKKKMAKEIADNEKLLADQELENTESDNIITSTTTKKYNPDGSLITTGKTGGFIPTGFRRRYS